MDSRDSSFGQNGSPGVLPITTPEADNPLTSQNLTESLSQKQTISADQFHVVDQDGQPIQYEFQSLGDSDAQMVSILCKYQFYAIWKNILVLLDDLNFLTLLTYHCFEILFPLHSF